MKERIKDILEMDNLGTLISGWEEQFLTSLSTQLERGKKQLSQKQVDVLHRVEAKIEKMVKGDPAWECVWDDEKAWNFKTAVNYYKASPERYFSQILEWSDRNEGKIPPQNYYKKVVENKYSQRVLNSLRQDPKYPSGSTVMLRATARTGLSYQVFSTHHRIPLFVVAPTEKAISAAAGCRIYTLLSSVSSLLFEVEERWIKKWRAPKPSSQTNISEDIPF